MGDIAEQRTALQNGTAESQNGVEGKKGRTTIIFSLPDKVGALADALKVFEKHQVNLHHIESRQSREKTNSYEFFVTCDSVRGELEKALESFKDHTLHLQVLDLPGNAKEQKDEVPWIPRTLQDLDLCAHRIIHEGLGLDEDHPGYNDPQYHARRKEFADIAFNYKQGQPIPRIQYMKEEIETWTAIYSKVTKLHKTNACQEYNNAFPLFVANCGFREDNLPQLQDVSDFLKGHTGFQLRPVAGFLSPRDFLACLAFRVFPCTQYIRHGSRAFYTPEPDICHEMLGHIPLFADPTFAQFSQEIGLASLGAPDEYIDKLSNLYWFTNEFGMCRQNGELKAYGAGLLSSVKELQYCLTDKPEFLPFDPSKMSEQSYPLTSFQPLYFVANSFEDAMKKLRDFADTIPRPFSVRYHADTQSVEVVESRDQIVHLAKTIHDDLSFLEDALKKVK